MARILANDDDPDLILGRDLLTRAGHDVLPALDAHLLPALAVVLEILAGTSFD
jgi:hypothetical protein